MGTSQIASQLTSDIFCESCKTRRWVSPSNWPAFRPPILLPPSVSCNKRERHGRTDCLVSTTAMATHPLHKQNSYCFASTRRRRPIKSNQIKSNQIKSNQAANFEQNSCTPAALTSFRCPPKPVNASSSSSAISLLCNHKISTLGAPTKVLFRIV